MPHGIGLTAGLALSGGLMVAAPVTGAEPQHVVEAYYAWAAVAGGGLRGLIRVYSVIGAPKPWTTPELSRAMFEAAFMVAAAFISALFVSPAVVAWLGVSEPRYVGFIFLAVGAVFWEVAPFAPRLAVGWARAKGRGVLDAVIGRRAGP